MPNRSTSLIFAIITGFIMALLTVSSVQAGSEEPWDEKDIDSILAEPDMDEEPNGQNDKSAPDDAAVVGWLELSEEIREGPLPFAWISKEEAGLSMEDVLKQFDTVAQGEQYLGVIVYLDDPLLDFTQINTIGRAMDAVRQSGKKVLAFAEHYDLWEYMLACHADMILLQHKGSIMMHGLASEEIYLLGLLEKIGAKADLIQIGKYKGADETLTRSLPSEAWNSNIDALLDDLYKQVVDTVCLGRGLSSEQFDEILAKIWEMRDVDYIRYQLVDRLTDRDMIDVTEIEFGDDFTWDLSMGVSISGRMRMDSPFALLNLLLMEPPRSTRRPTIAILHARGPIHSGESSIGDGLFASETIGSRTLIRELSDCRDDPNIKGVIVRIDSPGGSADASEVIWQSIREVSAVKPVYTCVGSMAASGGYYLACAGDEVYVSPQSIVGSIGVVGGKIVLGGLYEKLGITVTRRSRGPLSDMFNSVEPFDQSQREALYASLMLVYDQFTNRIRIGRGNRLTDITQVAEGRLFTGRQSIVNGLADRLGGMDTALTDLAEKLELEPGKFDLLHLPRPMSLHEFFNQAFGANGQAHSADLLATLQATKELIGPIGWRQSEQVLAGLMLLRHEPVLTLMPTVIVFR